MVDWISVEDKLPEEGEIVQFLHEETGRRWKIEIGQCMPRRWRLRGVNFDVDNVTHWMPLPDPPEVNDAD